jgi:hypothetical protein
MNMVSPLADKSAACGFEARVFPSWQRINLSQSCLRPVFETSRWGRIDKSTLTQIFPDLWRFVFSWAHLGPGRSLVTCR